MRGKEQETKARVCVCLRNKEKKTTAGTTGAYLGK